MSLPFAILGRFFTITAPNSRVLDLNLPGNLDHIRRLQIESIDDFHRISIKEREQRQTPAAKTGVFIFGDHRVPRAHKECLVEIDAAGQATSFQECLAQIRYLEKT